MREVISIPYSVYSHRRCDELIKLINEMGYEVVKMYPTKTNDTW